MFISNNYSLVIAVDAIKHYRPNKRPDFRGSLDLRWTLDNRDGNELTAEREVGHLDGNANV